jgi:hypothetical protein
MKVSKKILEDTHKIVEDTENYLNILATNEYIVSTIPKCY